MILNNLLIYDKNMKHVKTVDKINNKKIELLFVCVFACKPNEVYLSDCFNNVVWKTDCDLNYIAQYNMT